MTPSHTTGASRREEYAAATRQAILAAARHLFSERGYFATRVDEIAALARVAPATVYAVSGGKQGLLRTLVEIWSNAPLVAEASNSIQELGDPAAVIRVTAAACRTMWEECSDVVQVLLTTAPHDRQVAESLAVATERYRQAFVPIGRRLAELGCLRDGLDVDQTVDVLWFYFGYSGLATLHDGNGWAYDRAERWLCDQAIRALLQDRIASSPRSEQGSC
jgi:AcrR family transcriptional regulator